MKSYFVYIMSNKKDGVLYIGVTSNLEKRIFQHREGVFDGFTSKYKLYKLVYFEETGDIISAIAREKQLENWRRNWKIVLIEENNPNWEDLDSGY